MKINQNVPTSPGLSLNTANRDLQNIMAVATLYLPNLMQLYFQSTPTPEINENIQKGISRNVVLRITKFTVEQISILPYEESDSH